VSANPPKPVGWMRVQQSTITPEMTAWATEIVKNTKAYPMCSSTTQTFGAVTMLARVEWHPADFNVSKVHRGVTLYERDPWPLGASLNLPER
jgi:hypothetical protein